MLTKYIEVHDKDTGMKLAFNADKITVIGDHIIDTERDGFEVAESYDELKQLIFDAGCLIHKKDPRLEDKPLTMEDIRTMLGEPVWNSNSRSWALVKEVRENSVTLVYWLADWELADAEYLAKYPLYRMRAAACR